MISLRIAGSTKHQSYVAVWNIARAPIDAVMASQLNRLRGVML